MTIAVTLAILISCQTIDESTNPPSSFGSNFIDLAWQEEGYLWGAEATTRQVIRWDTRTGASITFEDMAGNLFVDSQNVLWVFDEYTIYRFNGRQFEPFEPSDGFVGGQVLAVVEDNRYIWLGTRGLSRFDQQSHVWEIVWPFPPHTASGAVSNEQFVEFLVEGVHAIAPTAAGEVWLGTNKGLARLENGTQQFWTDGSISSGVRCLLYTDNSELWVCTENGVGKWGDNHVRNLKQLHSPTILAEGNQGEIWVTTWESGIERFNGASGDRWQVGTDPDKQRPTELLVSEVTNNIWVSTKKGISRWDGIQWRHYGASDGLVSDFVNMIVQDSNGRIWAGTQDGVNVYDPSTDRWQPFP